MQENAAIYPDSRPIGGGKRLYPACKVCRRPLKNPKSQEIGMGPKCAGKMGRKGGGLPEESGRNAAARDFAEILAKTVAAVGAVFVPAEIMDVKLLRGEDGSPVTNVPWRYSYHSPTGMEFGYGGSGPADLALNILAMYLPPRVAWDLHQPFKWKFIALVDQQKGGVIKGSEIRAWILEQLTDEGD